MEKELNQERTPKFLGRTRQYVVGVDPGKMNDPTGISILEKVTGVLDSGSDWERHCGLTRDLKLQTPEERLYVVHLERLPLHLSYITITERVAEIMARPPTVRRRWSEARRFGH
jgi:hypothetical protein